MKVSPKTLVAHGDEEWRTLFADVLRASGTEVHTACDGLAALALARKNVYQMAVVDAELPQMNAMEFLLNLRDLSRPLPLVVVAGAHTETHALAWTKLGVYFAGPASAVARELPHAADAVWKTKAVRR